MKKTEQKMNDFGIFDIDSEKKFIDKSLEIFRFQARHNSVYKKFLELLSVNPEQIKRIDQIPFLPIEFFKNYRVTAADEPFEAVFKSSGTTGMNRSKHYIKHLSLYKKSFIRAFEYFYGDVTQYNILALLPSYVEQGNSSLVFMTDTLIRLSKKKHSGFYLDNHRKLGETLNKLHQKNEKILLIGVSYALLDLVESQQFELPGAIIMETGGMKGRRKEMIREELHEYLKKGFGVQNIHSEYGMTELLSQAYSMGDTNFQSPPWQKVLIRDTEDPFSYLPAGKTGGVNVIDLANIYSCSFIATQDLGKYTENTFEILGRFDHSDIRGCNLLVI
jgi:phenylacetate-coenzyme A ligase PaaK-like adenylate-forming protein